MPSAITIRTPPAVPPDLAPSPRIVVDQVGSGYSFAPNINIMDGTLFDPIRNNPGTGAAATSTLTIQTVAMDIFGEGYDSVPTVTITDSAGGTGTGATATADIDKGGVTGIALDYPGLRLHHRGRHQEVPGHLAEALQSRRCR